MQPVETCRAFQEASQQLINYSAVLKRPRARENEQEWFNRRVSEIHNIEEKLVQMPSSIDPYQGDLTGTLSQILLNWRDPFRVRSGSENVNNFFNAYFENIQLCFDLKMAVGKLVYDKSLGHYPLQQILAVEHNAKVHSAALDALGFGHLADFMRQVDIDVAALRGEVRIPMIPAPAASSAAAMAPPQAPSPVVPSASEGSSDGFVRSLAQSMGVNLTTLDQDMEALFRLVCPPPPYAGPSQ